MLQRLHDRLTMLSFERDPTKTVEKELKNLLKKRGLQVKTTGNHFFGWAVYTKTIFVRESSNSSWLAFYDNFDGNVCFPFQANCKGQLNDCDECWPVATGRFTMTDCTAFLGRVETLLASLFPGETNLVK